MCACPRAGAPRVLLSDGTPEPVLAREVADADLLLMGYAAVAAAVAAAATRLKATVKYGVGIDAIDIAAARARRSRCSAHARVRLRPAIAPPAVPAGVQHSALRSMRCCAPATRSRCPAC